MCINSSSEPYDLNQSARQEMQKSSIRLLIFDGFVKQPWSGLPALQSFVQAATAETRDICLFS